MNYYRNFPDRAALEREYSPSSCVTNWREILGQYTEKSEQARAFADAHVTLAYGGGPQETMDFFPAKGHRAGAGQPVLVYIHGGYWQELSSREHSFPALAANAAGLAYVAINYGLAPQVSLDEMVDRCRRAVLVLYERAEELGLDAEAIHLAGCSAGAQLAAMTALSDWAGANPVRSLTLLSGVYDLRPLPLTYVNDAVGLTGEAALLNSPLLLVDAFQGDLPPALVAVAENEPSEFKRQSKAFAEAIRIKGGCAELREFANRNHFDLIFDLLDPLTAFGAATLNHLRRASPGQS
ncbi:alpha/beta hydrolase [Phenylobacterium sp.]|uniref:alpha/beta hydrolase n=1 Tax=Phenylobacterium sp. TaxID=1871053 RepID=UPI002FCA8059